MRLLIMFGPMIVNGISRYMNSRPRTPERTPPPPNEEEYYEEENPEPEKPTYDDDDFVWGLGLSILAFSKSN